ncbi:MAG: arginase family protein [Luteibaculaceae bacterium]
MIQNLSIYLTPVSQAFEVNPGTIGSLIKFTVEPSAASPKGGVALIGLSHKEKGLAPDSSVDGENWRKALYQLFPSEFFKNTLYDLGDLLPGATEADTNFAIAQITQTLVRENIIPVFIGGEHSNLFAIYQGFEALEQVVNIGVSDAYIDITDEVKDTSESGFLSAIILKNPNYLFNLNLLGYQSYLSPFNITELIEKLGFTKKRLGDLKNRIGEAEPLIRDCNVFSIDTCSIKVSDFQSASKPQPNGFFSDEVCQLARYAGINEKLSVFQIAGFTRLSSKTDAALIAQIIWCFLDGYYNRKNDFPIGSKSELKKFMVALKESDTPLVFYKSKKTDRWWMEVPYLKGTKRNYESHTMVPCSYADYLEASKDEIPDLWIKTIQKLA